MNVKPYFVVFGFLAALTIVTVLAARMNLGMAVGILIAALKASLVGLFFMHLKYEGRFTHFVALFPVLLFVVLLLFLLPDFMPHSP